MKKYWFVYSIYWQEGLAQRASFFMERFRALVVLVSFYYFWTAILADKETIAGYDRTAMMTYVLGMNLLRSVVFASRTWEIASEINHGRLSGYLLKPVNFMLYTFFRDLSDKSINSISAIIEILGLSMVFGMAIRWPEHAMTWIYFIIAAGVAMAMNFILSFMVGCWGFWTAESGGPRWLLELFLEFSAGAFFPIDVLPERIQAVFRLLPSPYMVFFPLHVFLERVDSNGLINGFLAQAFWLTVFAIGARVVWAKGVKTYGAEGS